MKTMLYLASGKFYDDYLNLPFDQMIFVDRSTNLLRTYPENQRVRFIGKDAILAIDDLKRQNIKIDCLVTVNEGLYGGGGNYPIFSDFLMGYLSPLLNDEFVLVCDLNYYCSTLRTPMSKLDWGFEKVKKLTPSDNDYIDPSIFSYSQRQVQKNNYGNVYCMRRVEKSTKIPLSFTKTEVNLINGSIWKDEESLDFIGLNNISIYNIPGHHQNNINSIDEFFNSKPKVFNLQQKSFSEILNYCKNNNLKKIGLTPWKNNDYSEIIDNLHQLKDNFFESITFYHLNKKDFRQLYEYSNTVDLSILNSVSLSNNLK